MRIHIAIRTGPLPAPYPTTATVSGAIHARPRAPRIRGERRSQRSIGMLPTGLAMPIVFDEDRSRYSAPAEPHKASARTQHAGQRSAGDFADTGSYFFGCWIPVLRDSSPTCVR